MNSLLLLIGIANGTAHQLGPTSVHAAHTRDQLGAQVPAIHAIPTEPAPRVTSYGYLPDWIDDPLAVDLDSLSHVAWFNVSLNASGHATDTDSWHAVANTLVDSAHAVGTQVHLTVALFDETTQASVLSNESHRAQAVTELVSLVNDYGADGLNVDFEGMAWEQRDDLVQFVIELKAGVDEVYLATPAVDWSGAYDYDRLSAESDGLFIMAYGYHWSGGDPGPVGPLHGGGPWSVYAQDWSLEDYRTYGATDDKIVMGVPLYGRSWPSSSDAVPGTSTGTSSAHTMASAIATAADYDPRFDDTSQTPWVWTGTKQFWYDDMDSTETKLSWAIDQGIQGVGYWALGYTGGDPDFWQMVDRVTQIPEPEDTGEPLDTGTPEDTATPTDPGVIDAEDSGYAGEGDTTDKAGCGCATQGQSSLWPLIVLALCVTRRRD
jgi:uncharacterized protein (TIGR03382 family)